MFDENKLCADAGSVYCPCMMATGRECMVCSRMAGKDYCDCNWQGICIYNEFIQNGGMVHLQRKNRLCRVQKKIWYRKDLAVIRLEVPRGFAEFASTPGSCVFARPEASPECFAMPVSVMRADYENGIVELAVQECGPKSRLLLESDRAVMLRGVYKNGLLGVEKLLNKNRKKVLCLAKGVGVAPVSNYCRWAGYHDEIDVVADLDKISRLFAEDCFEGCACKNIRYEKMQIGDLTGMASEYDAVLLCVSDYYQKNIIVPPEKAVYSNNFTMCCGEGICGACLCHGEDGKLRRMCKCRSK